MSVAASSTDHYLQAAAAEDRLFDKKMVVAAEGCKAAAVDCRAVAVEDNRLSSQEWTVLARDSQDSLPGCDG